MSTGPANSDWIEDLGRRRGLGRKKIAYNRKFINEFVEELAALGIQCEMNEPEARDLVERRINEILPGKLETLTHDDLYRLLETSRVTPVEGGVVLAGTYAAYIYSYLVYVPARLTAPLTGVMVRAGQLSSDIFLVRMRKDRSPYFIPFDNHCNIGQFSKD